MERTALGVDIGGTGIKGGLVSLETGVLVSERYRVRTPAPATPTAVAAAVGELVRHFGSPDVVGVGYPGVIVDGICRTAPNMDPSFTGVDLGSLFSGAAGTEVAILNDADAAGVAEMRFGSGKGSPGTVLMLTFGTGIGSALIRRGHLVPNTELGHLELDGVEAETVASGKARKHDDLSWEEWVGRVNHYLAHVDMLFTPDLIIVGGGVSKKWDRFGHLVKATAPVVPAALRNNAGIAGAAWTAAEG